jgi:putative hydrolase
LDKDQDYHVHCSYNDHSASNLTIKNVIARAEKIGLKVIAITDHVRRTSDWVPRYLDELRAETTVARSNKLKVIPGFEARFSGTDPLIVVKNIDISTTISTSVEYEQ